MFLFPLVLVEPEPVFKILEAFFPNKLIFAPSGIGSALSLFLSRVAPSAKISSLTKFAAAAASSFVSKSG